MNLYIVWVFRLLLVLCAVYGVLALLAIRQKPRLQQLEVWYGLLVGMYVVGMCLKVGMVGPAFARWHLSDFGFPPTVELLLTLLRKSPPSVSRVQQIEREQKSFKSRLAVLSISLAASVGYELLTGLMVRIAHQKHRAAPHTALHIQVGGFDWMDVAAYCLGALCGGVILYLSLRLVNGLMPAAIALDAEDKAKDAETRKKQRVQKPRAKKGRPGGRH